MRVIDHVPEHPVAEVAGEVKSLLMKPLGGLIFRAKLVGADYQSYRQARQEAWSGDKAELRTRHSELYEARRAVLVEETLVRGEGSQRFLSRLAIEDGELDGASTSLRVTLEVPDYPDLSQPAGGPLDTQ